MPARSRRPKGARQEGLEPSGERTKGTAAGWLGPEEDAFDLWLQQSLHTAFDAIAAEPILTRQIDTRERAFCGTAAQLVATPLACRRLTRPRSRVDRRSRPVGDNV